MNLGDVNKGAVILILVLLIGAGGYLWYSQMYTPALAAKEVAMQTQSTAQQGLDKAKADLTAAQQRIEEAKKKNSKLDDSVSRLAVARAGVPTDTLLDDAAIVLGDMAVQAGVDTRFKGGEDGDESSGAAPAAGELQGATPVDLQFEAAGTYSEMMSFMRLVESSVEMDGNKLYSRGRLFNVVKLQIGGGDDQASNSGASDFGSLGGTATASTETDELQMGPKDIRFTVTVRMYTSSTANAQSVGAPDAAAAGATTPGATSTTPTDGTTPAGTPGAPTDGSEAASGAAPAADGSVPAGATPAPGATPDAGGAVPAAGTPATTTAPAGSAAGG